MSDTPSSFAFSVKRSDQMPVLDHVGERLARLDLAGEGEKDRPNGVAEPAVGDHHVEDRLRLAGDASQTPSVSNSRRTDATMAEARSSSAWLAPSAGSASVTANDGPSACRKAIARVRPANPPPAISTSVVLRAMPPPYHAGPGPGLTPEPIPYARKRDTGRLTPRNWCNDDWAMASAVQEIIDILDLEPLEVNLFRGRSPQSAGSGCSAAR